eukprot:TRINITY_DN40680_c0_g1_i1.p1 TRINITY_DN40680_c0_g1~~TRINITY_DN40680_c0_g1_i1.p1  ORF type:complete len:971 (-),score=181.44 TRINITY_DN40680_c0_g1_i1:341-3136(-)
MPPRPPPPPPPTRPVPSPEKLSSESNDAISSEPLSFLGESKEPLPLGLSMLKRRNHQYGFLAETLAGTLAQSVHWSQRFFLLSANLLEYWTSAESQKGGSPQGVFRVDEIDGVAADRRSILIHFSKTQNTGKRRRQRELLCLYASSAQEAERFAAALRTCTAAALTRSLQLPAEWDICRMLRETSEGARMVARLPLDEQSLDAVQQLMDHTFFAKRTKDRSGREMPVRLKVIEVVKVQNTSSWIGYSRTRANIGATQRQQEPLSPAVRTSTYDNPLASNILGDLDESAVEHWLFHGTTGSAVQGITNTDFRLDLAGSHKGTLYGHGLYCAECSSKADEYAEPDDGLCRMLLCRAVLGRILLDNSVKPQSEELVRICNAEYNSLCGDRWAAVKTYREFVFFNSGQVYPAYIIVYRRVLQAEFLTSVGAAVASLEEAVNEGKPADAAVQECLQLIPHTLKLAETHPESDVRYRISMLLSARFAVLVPVILLLVDSPMRLVRRSAIVMLGQFADYASSGGHFSEEADAQRAAMAPSVVPVLKARVSDDCEDVRRVAAQSLASFGRHAEPAVPVLIMHLNDHSADVRQATAASLGTLASVARSALFTLMEHLEDESKGVRQAVSQSLGQLCWEHRLWTEAPRALTGLIDRLADEDAGVRKSAATSLGLSGMFCGSSVLSSLAKCLASDASEEVREAAAKAIGQVGLYSGFFDDTVAEASLEAAKALSTCLQDESILVRRASIAACGMMTVHAEKAVPGLRKCLGDTDHKDLRLLAAETLGKLGRRAGAAALDLGITLRDPDLQVRKAAASAIGMLEDQCLRALPSLTERIKDEEAEVRREAAMALVRLGLHAEQAVPSLKEFLNDGNAGVRRFAEWAYSRLAQELGDRLPDVLDNGVKYAFLDNYKFGRRVKNMQSRCDVAKPESGCRCATCRAG